MVTSHVVWPSDPHLLLLTSLLQLQWDSSLLLLPPIKPQDLCCCYPCGVKCSSPRCTHDSLPHLLQKLSSNVTISMRPSLTILFYIWQHFPALFCSHTF